MREEQLCDSLETTRAEFLNRHRVPESEAEAANSQIDAIVQTHVRFAPDWLQTRGWRVGLWMADVVLPGDHIRRLCRCAAAAGAEELWMGRNSIAGLPLFRVPADSPLHIDMALCQLADAMVRIVPTNRRFGLTHGWGQLTAYAAGPELMPDLSHYGEAQSEWSVISAKMADEFGPNGNAYTREILAANDGFWWWQ
jgi:hypothetical protein